MGNKHTSSLKDVSASSGSTKPQPQSLSARGIRESVSFNCEETGGGGGAGVVVNVVPPTVDNLMVKAQPLGLSNYQKNLLREAWQRIGKKGASSIGAQIFRRMFDSNADIKKVFQHVTVLEGMFSSGLTSVQAYQHHSELFIDILDESIVNIDDLNSLIPKLNEYGAKHSPFKAYGFKAEYWDIFGEAMIAAAREWEGWRKHRETLRAWTLLISFIVDRMRQGYESALRRPGFVHQSSLQHNHNDNNDNDDGDDVDKKFDDNHHHHQQQQQQQRNASFSSDETVAEKNIRQHQHSSTDNAISDKFARYDSKNDDEGDLESPKHPRSF